MSCFCSLCTRKQTSLKIISAVFTCWDMKTGKRNNLPELKTHTHTCRNLLYESDTVRSPEVRWFQTKLHHILAAVNMSSVFRWICGCFPPSTQQQNIRDLGERFTLSLWRDTGWPDHRFDRRVEDCGTEGEFLWWRLLLDTGPKLNHVSVTVGGYGEGKWFLTMGEKDLYS